MKKRWIVLAVFLLAVLATTIKVADWVSAAGVTYGNIPGRGVLIYQRNTDGTYELVTNDTPLKVDAEVDSPLAVNVLSAPTTAVTGTFWQTTQPVSGTVTSTPSGKTVVQGGSTTDTPLYIRPLTAATDTVHLDSPILATVIMTDVTLDIPTFYEITLTDTATVDSSINLPAKCVAYEFWTVNTTHTLKWNVSAGAAGTYMTKNPGVPYNTFGLGPEKLYTGRIYFKDTTEAGCVVNVIVWTKP